MSITELEQRCNTLRNDLKAWEKQFAAQHNGKKAGREDIKADAVICTHATYSIYMELLLILSSTKVQGVQQTTSSAAYEGSPSDTLETSDKSQAYHEYRTHARSTTESPRTYSTQAEKRRRAGHTGGRRSV
jgi:hypothetical protein